MDVVAEVTQNNGLLYGVGVVVVVCLFFIYQSVAIGLVVRRSHTCCSP
jgi:hypothetical protein